MAILTNDGLIRKAYRMFGDTSGNFQYVALGTGTGAEASGNTALGAELDTSGASRMQADTMAYEADYKAKWIATWTFTGTIGINEMGIFDDSSNNNCMLMRHKFAAAKDVENGDSLQLTLKETESRV